LHNLCSMKNMLALSIVLHGFSVIMLSFSSMSMGWKAPSLQTYHVNLVQLPEKKVLSKPRPLIQKSQPNKKVAVSKKSQPEKVVEEVRIPASKRLQREILKPTVVQKPTVPRKEKLSKRQERVRELKEKLAAISEGKKATLPQAEQDSSVSIPNVIPKLEVSNFPFPLYLLNADKKLRSRWAPPPVGTISQAHEVVVVFEIGRQGDIGEARVEKSSGNQYFDLAALRAVYDSNPFPPLPRDYLERSLRVHVSFLLTRDL